MLRDAQLKKYKVLRHYLSEFIVEAVDENDAMALAGDFPDIQPELTNVEVVELDETDS